MRRFYIPWRSLIALLARAAKGWRGRESWRLLKLQKERETWRLRRFDLWEPRSILRLCEEGSVASRLEIAWNLHFLGRLQFLMQSNLFYVLTIFKEFFFLRNIYFFLFIKFSQINSKDAIKYCNLNMHFSFSFSQTFVNYTDKKLDHRIIVYK